MKGPSLFYTLNNDLDNIITRFKIEECTVESYFPNSNVKPWDNSFVITNVEPSKLNFFNWGFAPTNRIRKGFWGQYIRIEGKSNLNNKPDYKGELGILKNEKYKNLLQIQRCLVLANGIYTGKDESGKNHLLQMAEKKPFALAGIWNKQLTSDGGEVMCFGILTMPANKVLRSYNKTRIPIILKPDDEKKWLNQKTGLFELISMFQPIDNDLFVINTTVN